MTTFEIFASGDVPFGTIPISEVKKYAKVRQQPFHEI